MSEVQPRPNPTSDLDMVDDSISIYQGGYYSRIEVADLLNNETALRQFTNEFNSLKRINEKNNKIIDGLRMERSAYSLQTLLQVVLSIVNVSSAVIISIGVNLYTSEDPPSGILVILVGSWVILAISSIGPIFVPFVARYYIERNENADKRR